jgi:hypothetical protein
MTLAPFCICRDKKNMNDKIITGKMLKQHGWPQGKIIGLAKAAALVLGESGLERDAILTQLDAVRQGPAEFIAHGVLGDLAREYLRLQANEVSVAEDKLLMRPSRSRRGAPKALILAPHSKCKTPCACRLPPPAR